MLHTAFRRGLAAGIAGAALLAAALSPAHAVGLDRAKRAFSAAEAKISAATQAGADERASEVMAQAKAALERARAQVRDDDEDHAWHAANEASAYADLAIATAELRALEARKADLAR